MTAYTSGGIWSLPARFELGLAPSPDVRWRVDETVALRRCAMYRKAFRGAAISYPAEVLRLGVVATWIARFGVSVGVATVDELDCALAAGISPLRIVMYPAGEADGPIGRAVNVGVGRFVLNSGQQVAILASSARRIQRVLIDVNEHSADAMAAVTSSNRLDMIGLHCRLGGADHETAADIVRGMIAQMSRVRREHGVILTRVSLAGLEATAGCGDRHDLRRVAEVLDDAVEDGCARHRYPRPALVLSPSPAALLPGA